MYLAWCPNEILAKIFSHVAVEDLPACQNVSKLWRGLIKATVLNRGSKASRIKEIDTTFRSLIECESNNSVDIDRAEFILRITEFNVGARPDLLTRAIYRGKLTIARLLLSRADLSVDAANTCGHLPLHVAAMTGRADIIPAIAAHKTYRRGRTADGYGALHWAVLSESDDDARLAVVRALMAAGDSPVDAVDDAGRTALHHALLCGDLDTFRLLAEEYGADVEARAGSTNLTPLQSATIDSDARMVEYLASLPQVDVNSRAVPTGLSPLMTAVVTPEGEAVADVLLRCPRVVLDAAGLGGMTALEVAKLMGRHDLAGRISGEIERRRIEGKINLKQNRKSPRRR